MKIYVAGIVALLAFVGGHSYAQPLSLATPKTERPFIDGLQAIEGIAEVATGTAHDGRMSYVATIKAPSDMTPSGVLIAVSGRLWQALHETPAAARPAIGALTVNIDDPQGVRALRFTVLGSDLDKIDGSRPADRLDLYQAARVNPTALSAVGRVYLTAFCTAPRRSWSLCRTGL